MEVQNKGQNVHQGVAPPVDPTTTTEHIAKTQNIHTIQIQPDLITPNITALLQAVFLKKIKDLSAFAAPHIFA